MSQLNMAATVSTEQLRSMVLQRWNIQVKGQGSELHGPCPFCMAGTDRFIVWVEGNYWCRSCESRGWVEEGKRGWKPDPQRDQAFRVYLAAKETERRQKLAEWQAGYAAGHSAGYAQGWHDAMSAVQRQYWVDAGLSEWMIDYYGLGYCPNKRFLDENKQEFFSPAHTIPIREPHNWEIVNIQYRLEKIPPKGGGKYRQENGIPAAAFYAEPQRLDGEVVVLEGAKKAGVLFEHLGYQFQLVGWPSMTPALSLIEELKCFDRVYLGLDPGPKTRTAVERAAGALGKKLRVMDLPAKPDDLVTQYKITPEQFKKYMLQARAV